MKNLILSIIPLSIIGLLFSCKLGDRVSQKILLTNNSDVDLTDKAITIKRSQLKEVDEKLFPILHTENGEQVASQLEDHDGDGSWDKLFFVVDIPANEKLTLALTWAEEKPDYEVRTSVRFGKRDSKNDKVTPRTSDTLFANEVHRALGYQPYQTDGPSWENDRVGFRHYFDGRNANDLFGKRVSYMSPDSVGINADGAVEDNYHEMWDWGRDILSVGNSVGIGGFGLLIGDSIIRLGITGQDTLNNIETSIFSIVEEGPVRSIMQYDYINWKVGDRLYQVNEKTKIWPGMYAYKNRVKIKGLRGDETLFVGLVNRDTEEDLVELSVDDKWIVLYTHDKQTYNKEWYLGLALILPKEAYLGYGEAPEETAVANTYYAKMKIENDTPVSYYASGCWELADPLFTDSLYFENYIIDLAKQLGAEVSIDVD